MSLAKTKYDNSNRLSDISRENLIKENLPHVQRIVWRIASHLPKNVDVEELFHAGVIGLIEAVERYDPNRGTKFITYALFRIKGAVLSELRSRDFLSRSNRRKSRELQNASLMLEKKLGRQPNDEELANELGIDIDEFHKAKRLTSISFVSIDEIGMPSKTAQNTLMDILDGEGIGDALKSIRMNEIIAVIRNVINQLSKKEQTILSLYYWDELTMKEIGEIMEITESRVSQIHSQAIIRMRGKLKKEGFFDRA